MKTQSARAKYQAPKLEVQFLRELPSALAGSGSCHPSTTNPHEITCDNSDGKHSVTHISHR